MDNTACSTRATSRTRVTELLTLIDSTEFPAETQRMIRTIGPLIGEGCSRAEISRKLGWKDTETAAALNLIRDAILEQCRRQLDTLEPRLRDLVERLGGSG
jgi:hypothetical protein